VIDAIRHVLEFEPTNVELAAITNQILHEPDAEFVLEPSNVVLG
jgi:hypothetical protein